MSDHERRLATFKTTRKMALDLLESLSQMELDRKPGNRKWSPREVFNHISLFDTFFIKACKRLIDRARRGMSTHIAFSVSDIDVAPSWLPKSALPFFAIPISITSSFTPPPLRSLLVRSRFLQFQHPAFATPTPGLAKSELTLRLNATSDQLTNLYEANVELPFERMTISHPIIGRFDMLQIIDFANDHERRHLAAVQETIGRIGQSCRCSQERRTQHASATR